MSNSVFVNQSKPTRNRESRPRKTDRGTPSAQIQLSHEQAQKHFAAYYGGIIVTGDFNTSGSGSWG